MSEPRHGPLTDVRVMERDQDLEPIKGWGRCPKCGLMIRLWRGHLRGETAVACAGCDYGEAYDYRSFQRSPRTPTGGKDDG